MYEQQTTLGSVRSDPQTFGAGVGQAVAQAGGAVADIGEQMIKRDEAIKSIVEFTSFNDTLRQDLEALRSSDNIALGETVDKYKALTNQRVDEYLDKIQGRTSFKASLRNQFTNQAGQYVQQARSEQVKAQYSLAGTYIKDLSSKLASDVAFSPDKMDDYVTMFNMGVDKFEGAFDRNTIDSLRKAGTSDLVQSTITTMLERGDWESAKKLRDRPDLQQYMGGENGLRLSLQIYKGEGKAIKEKQEADRNKTMWSNFLGRPITDAEAPTLPVFEKIDSPMERLSALALVRGKPATPQETEQLLGLPSRDSASKVNRLSELTVKVLNGAANQTEMIEFQSLAGTTHGQMFKENDQGRDQWVPNVNMPPAVRRALEMTGVTQRTGTGQSAGSFLGGQPIGSAVSSGQGAGVEDITLMMAGKPFAQGQRLPDGSFSNVKGIPGTEQPSSDPFRDRPRTVFEALDVTAGPVNKGLGVTRQVFGSLGPDAGAKTLQNESTVKNFINQAVQRLSSNDSRLLAQEREDLIKELGKMDSLITSETGAQESAFGIDVSLERAEKRLRETATNTSLAAKDSNEARKLLGDLKAMRRDLGVVRPLDQKELKEHYVEGRIDIGSVFFLPNGKPETFTQDHYDALFGKKK
jgi:hypothetical protein